MNGKRLLVALLLLAVAVVGVLVLRNGGTDPGQGAGETSSPSPVVAGGVAVLEPGVTPGPVPELGPEDPPAPTFTPEPSPEGDPAETENWVVVTTLSGAASGRGPSFELTGAPARLRFVLSGDSAALDVFVTREGRTSLEEGAVPEVRATGAGSGQTLLAKAAGTYYLDVYSRSASWTVVVEERRD